MSLLVLLHDECNEIKRNFEFLHHRISAEAKASKLNARMNFITHLVAEKDEKNIPDTKPKESRRFRKTSTSSLRVEFA